MKLAVLRLRVDRKWWMLAVALGAGTAAAWLSQRHIQGRIEAIEAEALAARTPAVVASVDLRPGQVVTIETVAVRDIPGEWLPSGFIAPERFAQVEGGVLAHPVRAGDPILWAHLAPDRPAALSDRLAEGRRAVTIPVDEISSVSGLLQPGDVIDLYVSLDHRGKRVTVPLLQRMRVLATGHHTDSSGPEGESGRSGFSTVTLDATPDEAVKLIAARDGGVLTAMLRRPGDGSSSPPKPAGDLPALLGLKAPAPKPRRPSSSVAVIYGDKAPRSIPRLDEPHGVGAAPEGEWTDGGETTYDNSARWSQSVRAEASPGPGGGTITEASGRP